MKRRKFYLLIFLILLTAAALHTYTVSLRKQTAIQLIETEANSLYFDTPDWFKHLPKSLQEVLKFSYLSDLYIGSTQEAYELVEHIKYLAPKELSIDLTIWNGDDMLDQFPPEYAVDKIFAELPHITSVKKLYIDSAVLRKKHLEKLTEINGLKELNLHIQTEETDTLLRIISKMTQLESLQISTLSYADPQEFRYLKSMTQLKDLSIRVLMFESGVNHQDDHENSHIRFLPTLKNLENFWYNHKITFTEETRSHLDRFPNLKHVILSINSDTAPMMRQWLEKRKDLEVTLYCEDPIDLQLLTHPRIHPMYFYVPDGTRTKDIIENLKTCQWPNHFKISATLNFSFCNIDSMDWDQISDNVKQLYVAIADDQMTKSRQEELEKKGKIWIHSYAEKRPPSQYTPDVSQQLKKIYGEKVIISFPCHLREKLPDSLHSQHISKIIVEAKNQKLDLNPLFELFHDLKELTVEAASIKPLSTPTKLEMLNIKLTDSKTPLHRLMPLSQLKTLNINAPGCLVTLDKFPRLEKLTLLNATLTATAVEKSTLKKIELTGTWRNRSGKLPAIDNAAVLSEFIEHSQIETLYLTINDPSELATAAVFASKTEELDLKQINLEDGELLDLIQHHPWPELTQLSLPLNRRVDRSTLVKIVQDLKKLETLILNNKNYSRNDAISLLKVKERLWLYRYE